MLLPLALPGPDDEPKNALFHRYFGLYDNVRGRLCLTFAEKILAHACNRVPRHSQISSWQACLAGAAEDEHLRKLQNITAAGYMCASVSVYLFLVQHILDPHKYNKSAQCCLVS